MCFQLSFKSRITKIDLHHKDPGHLFQQGHNQYPIPHFGCKVSVKPENVSDVH